MLEEQNNTVEKQQKSIYVKRLIAFITTLLLSITICGGGYSLGFPLSSPPHMPTGLNNFLGLLWMLSGLGLIVGAAGTLVAFIQWIYERSE